MKRMLKLPFLFLIPSLLVLLHAAVAFAQDSAASNDIATGVNVETQIVIGLVGIALTILSALVPLLVHKLVVKFHLDNVLVQESQLDKYVTQAISYAEQKADNAAKQSLAKYSSEDKLNAALTFVKDQLFQKGLPVQTETSIIKLIESKLGEPKSPVPSANLSGKVAAPVVALLLLMICTTSCAWFQKHAEPVVTDFTQCVGPDIKQSPTTILHDVEGILACDPTLNTTELPACVTEALGSLAEQLGVGGEDVVTCMVAYLSGTKSAGPNSDLVAKRAAAYIKGKHVKLAKQTALNYLQLKHG
jgi:hypothetical protein